MKGVLKLIPENMRVWIAVLLTIAVVVTIGAYVFSKVETPVDRPWDYGSVPFVPAKSHHSDHRVEMPPLPNPAATRPAAGAPGGSR